MATANSLKESLKQNEGKKANPNHLGLKSLMAQESIQKKFREVLKEKSQGFTASVLSLVNNDAYLAQSQPLSIITGAMTAATLDLPLDKNLGYAYLVPFKDKNEGFMHKAQFILGYKGYIQLAQRSGKYKAINVVPIYEGEMKSWNKLTEEFDYDMHGKVSDTVIGYVGYFKLINGFEKTVYWTKEEIEAHRIKHNKQKNKQQLSGVWLSDYDAMACKTVLRSMLSKWGILSIEMQTAETRDETVMSMDEDTGEIKIAEPVFDDEMPVHDATGELMEIRESELAGDNKQEALFETGVTSKFE